MSNFPKKDSSYSDGFYWRIAGYSDGRAPSVEISSELDEDGEPNEYFPIIGEALVNLGVALLRYDADTFEPDEEEEEPRRPMPYKRPKPEKKTSAEEPFTFGGYL